MAGAVDDKQKDQHGSFPTLTRKQVDLLTCSQANPEWTQAMFSNWTATVDEFAGYDNLLTFSVAFESFADNNDSEDSPNCLQRLR